MAKLITMKINGKEVKVEEGANLIDAAESVGFHIPNLCYLKGLKGIGACRMCLVEIEGMKAPMTACTLKSKEGMSIQTDTERVREIRKFVTDLIVSMHPLDCMTCTKASECNLMKYAYDLEVKESSFERKSFAFGADDKNPFIRLDPDYCVLCSKCIRICKHQGTNVLDFKGRGVGMRVIAGSDQSLHESGCTFCGSCIDVCPVNAIIEADRWRKGREWQYETFNSVCLYCGCDCEVKVSVKENMVTKINAGASEGKVAFYVCAIGRFGFDAINGEGRLYNPMKRINSELVETSWEDALGIVAEKLKKAGDSIGLISTAGITNESAFILSKFARDIIGTENIDTTARLYAEDPMVFLSGKADIEGADLIVLAGLDPSQWSRLLPAIDAQIRKKIDRGAKLIIVNSRETGLDSIASLKVIPEEIEKTKELYSAAKNPVVLFSPYYANIVASLKPSQAVAIGLEGNVSGVISMGLIPGKGGKTYNEIIGGNLKALYVVGNIPAKDRPDTDFLIVQTSHLTGLAKTADIVLPSTMTLEEDGTIVDFSGNLKNLHKAVESSGAKNTVEIISSLSTLMGKPISGPKTSDIKKSITSSAKKAPSLDKVKAGVEKPYDLELIKSINAPIIHGSRIQWLEEIEKAIGV
jgi:predicted molibdopterin-dependent oxidoreductase YjgC